MIRSTLGQGKLCVGVIKGTPYDYQQNLRDSTDLNSSKAHASGIRMSQWTNDWNVLNGWNDC